MDNMNQVVSDLQGHNMWADSLDKSDDRLPPHPINGQRRTEWAQYLLYHNPQLPAV